MRVTTRSPVEMMAVSERELPSDIAIFTAAVADWRVAEEKGQKIKKNNSGIPDLKFVENPDILQTISKRTAKRPKLVVGFAAETESLVENAREKLKKKGCDLVVANDVSRERGVFGGDQNTVQLVSASGVESWGLMSKQDVAQRLMAQLAVHLTTGKA
jgi:phosphopantothenoylcysteine decarboxylase/phosphopantothenate--cysteine ligase